MSFASILLSSTALVSPSRDLLALARRGELFVSSPAARAELSRLVDDAVAQSTPPEWPRDAELLCQDWQLLCTTNTGAIGPILPQMASNPSQLGAVDVKQCWRQDGEALRCDNVIKISRPENTWSSAWTLLPPGGESSLTLLHAATVVSDKAPLKISISLDRVALDGNRRAGETPEEIVSLPVPPPLLPLQGSLSEAGTFEVVLLDEEVRVARSGSTLRIFAREEAAASEEAAARSGVRGRSSAPVMMARPRPRKTSRKAVARRSSSSAPPAKKEGLDPTLPSLLYYGVYVAVFGRMALALVERIGS